MDIDDYDTVSPEEFEKILDMSKHPKEPTQSLKEAFEKYGDKMETKITKTTITIDGKETVSECVSFDKIGKIINPINELVNECVSEILNKNKETNQLGEFFQKEWPEQIKEGSAVDNAIRLLREYKDRITGAKT